MALELCCRRCRCRPGTVHRIRRERPGRRGRGERVRVDAEVVFRTEGGTGSALRPDPPGSRGDGHVASFFPGSEALREPRRLVTAPGSSRCGPAGSRLPLRHPECASLMVLVTATPRRRRCGARFAPRAA